MYTLLLKSGINFALCLSNQLEQSFLDNYNKQDIIDLVLTLLSKLPSIITKTQHSGVCTTSDIARYKMT